MWFKKYIGSDHEFCKDVNLAIIDSNMVKLLTSWQLSNNQELKRKRMPNYFILDRGLNIKRHQSKQENIIR
jgi:hypothetical protein